MADRQKELEELRASVREDAIENWPRMDKDGDGQITFEEFYEIAGGEGCSKQTQEALRPMFLAMDIDNDGTINLEEYIEFKFKLEAEDL